MQKINDQPEWLEQQNMCDEIRAKIQEKKNLITRLSTVSKQDMLANIMKGKNGDNSLTIAQAKNDIKFLEQALGEESSKLHGSIKATLSRKVCSEHSEAHREICQSILLCIRQLQDALQQEQELRRSILQSGYDCVLPDKSMRRVDFQPYMNDLELYTEGGQC